MIAGGNAHQYTYGLPYRYQAIFQAAEDDARTHERGLCNHLIAPGATFSFNGTTGERTAARASSRRR